jgi:hypothetical protein
MANVKIVSSYQDSVLDVRTRQALEDYKSAGVNVAFLVPTNTGLRKFILDANTQLRNFLRDSGEHDFTTQGVGQSAKKIIPVMWWSPEEESILSMSLYRPKTKRGDPRLWIGGLSKKVNARDVLVFMHNGMGIVVLNASDKATQRALRDNDPSLNSTLGFGRQIPNYYDLKLKYANTPSQYDAHDHGDVLTRGLGQLEAEAVESKERGAGSWGNGVLWCLEKVRGLLRKT